MDKTREVEWHKQSSQYTVCVFHHYWNVAWTIKFKNRKYWIAWLNQPNYARLHQWRPILRFSSGRNIYTISNVTMHYRHASNKMMWYTVMHSPNIIYPWPPYSDKWPIILTLVSHPMVKRALVVSKSLHLMTIWINGKFTNVYHWDRECNQA